MDDNYGQYNDSYNGEQMSMPGYQQQNTYAPNYGQNDYLSDPGEQDAKNCRLFGILSLFFIPTLFSILSLVKYSDYQKSGNGSHQSEAKTGRTCSIVSLVLQGVSVVIGIIVLIASVLLTVGAESRLLEHSNHTFDDTNPFVEEFDENFYSQNEDVVKF